MKLKQIVLSLVFFVTTAIVTSAQAESNSGFVTKTRYHTDDNPTVAARHHVMFQMTPGGLCSWYWFSPTDLLEASIVSKAKTDGLPLSIEYDPAFISPWGDANVCRVYAVDLT